MSYKIEPGSPVAEMIGLEITGNVVPLEWFKYIKHENGKPDSCAILLLADIVYWYRPVEQRIERTGEKINYGKKFEADKLQHSYSEMAERYGYTKDQVKEGLSCLRSLGLIDLDFRTIMNRGVISNNVLFIGLNVKRLKEITFPPLPDLNGIGVSEINTPPMGFKAGSLPVLNQIPMGFKGETNTEITSETPEITTDNMSASALVASPANGNGIIKNQGAYNALLAHERNKGEIDFSYFSESIRETVRVFCELWNVRPPAKSSRRGGQFSLWEQEAAELQYACGEFGTQALRDYYEDWKNLKPEKKFVPGRPGSLTWYINSKTASMRAGKKNGKPQKSMTFAAFMEMIQEVDREHAYAYNENDWRDYCRREGMIPA